MELLIEFEPGHVSPNLLFSNHFIFPMIGLKRAA